jgi:hypothetical protein
MNYFRPFSVTLIQDIYTLVTQEYINVQATYKNISWKKNTKPSEKLRIKLEIRRNRGNFDTPQNTM